jgi:hypothetical protein
MFLVKLAAAVAAAFALALLFTLPSLAATHGRPVHAPRPVVTAPYNPCRPGHPPVSPDSGHCQGTRYIPS